MGMSFEDGISCVKSEGGYIESTVSGFRIYYDDVINNNPFTISPYEYEEGWIYSHGL